MERDYAKVALRYAKWATRKRNSLVCKWVRLAAQRHLDDLARAKSDPKWGYHYDLGKAHQVCGFVELLPHVEGEWGSATIQLEDWQVFILSCVFGWRRDSDGHRRFNTAYIELARKNGKSALSSAVALYCLCREGEVGPQVKTAATTGDQARIVFDVARKMVSATPELREGYGIEVLANSIPCAASGGNIKPINAKASTQDGLNPHLTIIDELHAHKDRDLFDVLKSARGARKNPLSWYITTAGYNVEGVCYEQRTMVTKILEGSIEGIDHYFGIIFTLDEGDSEFAVSSWKKANPNWGVSVNVEEFKGYADEAKVSADSQGEFITKRCNVWQSARDGWVNMEMWKKCDGPVDLVALESVPCWMGIDLASTLDMSSVFMVWPVDGRLKVWGRFYLPEDQVKPRTERGNVPYQRWVNEGHIKTIGGDRQDYSIIQSDVEGWLSRFNVREVAYDDWNATDLTNRLAANGAPLVEFRQGAKSYNAPMKALARHYMSGTLDHGGDPVLTWNASNVVIHADDNGNIKPSKKRSADKIDGFCCVAMALGLSMTHEDAGPSVYETRGVRVV